MEEKEKEKERKKTCKNDTPFSRSAHMIMIHIPSSDSHIQRKLNPSTLGISLRKKKKEEEEER